MKIAAINGSPHGSFGATDILVSTFVEGAASEGAEIARVYLADKHLEFCRGCHACWTTSPGSCVIDDDLGEILTAMKGADFIVLASPMHFLSVSGNLKVFIDRLTSTGGDPHTHEQATTPTRPRMAAIMCCGFPKLEQFRSTSLWMEDLSALLGRELFMEAYVCTARRLAGNSTALSQEAKTWLEGLRDAGRKAARLEDLSAESRLMLKNGF